MLIPRREITIRFATPACGESVAVDEPAARGRLGVGEAWDAVGEPTRTDRLVVAEAWDAV
jgi:hypothetical protein